MTPAVGQQDGSQWRLTKARAFTKNLYPHLLLHLGHDFGVAKDRVEVELVLGCKLSGKVLGEGHVEQVAAQLMVPVNVSNLWAGG